jgi:predicted aspartyl protease
VVQPGRLVAGYLLAVPVSINGRGPWDFVVDTGTNQTVIDEGLATELQTKISTSVSLNTLTGSQSATLTKADSISVAGQEVANLEILVGEMKAMQKLDGRLRGILGLDYLYHFAFSLDYDHTQLRLLPATELEDPDGSDGTKVAVRLADGRVLVPCTWQGTSERLLVLDSAIATVLVLEDQRNAAMPATGGARWSLTTNAGATGVTQKKLRDFAIGEQRLPEIKAVTMARTAALDSLRAEGLLAASLFRSVFVNPRAQIATFRTK